MSLDSLADYTRAVEETKSSGRPLVIHFTANWIQHCKNIAPFYDAQVAKYPELDFKRVDVGKNRAAANAAGILAMPTFVVYAGGKETDNLKGGSEDKLIDLLDKAAGKPVSTELKDKKPARSGGDGSGLFKLSILVLAAAAIGSAAYAYRQNK